MKFFAKLGLNSKVISRIHIHDSDAPTEEAGIEFLNKQTNYPFWKEYKKDKSIRKNSATIGLASYGSTALAVWVWNVIDVKHFVLKEYYKSNKVDLGLNNKGQVELQIAF